MSQYSVYAIRNSATGRAYIGVTPRLDARWAEHRYKLRNSKHPCKKLQSDWSVYGEDLFEFTVLEKAPRDPQAAEQSWFEREANTYNRRPDCRSNKGLRHSKESKQQIGQTLRKKGHMPSPEARTKSHRQMRGQPKPANVIDALHAGHKKWRETPGNTTKSAQKRASLSEAAVRKVRASKGTCKEIAEQFNISPAMVSLIKNRKRYAWVP